ncbi:hypothetical protein ACWDSF_09555 [Nocardia beijingensis]
MLNSLAPSEGPAFVLHDMFAIPFQEVGQILGGSTHATEMIASRTRYKADESAVDLVTLDCQAVLQSAYGDSNAARAGTR